VTNDQQKSLIEYAQARTEMAQAESEVDKCIDAIDHVRNELQKWKEHGGLNIDVGRLPDGRELAKFLNAFGAAKTAADRAARNLPEGLRKLFQQV
jgi:hypothetical protein